MMRRRPNRAETVSWLFVPTEDGPTEARALIERWSSGLEPELVQTIQLLAAELVSLSLRSRVDPGNPVGLALDLDESCVRVEVVRADGRLALPSAEAGVPDLSLSLVDELADRWGVSRSERVTVCWLELDRLATDTRAFTVP